MPAGTGAGAVAWLGSHLGNMFLWVLSQPVRWLLYLELYLLMRDAQRAEYLADSLAADVAGTDAAVGLAEKLLLAPTVEGVVQRAVHVGPGEGHDLFDEIAATIEAVPDRERERRRRVARLEEARLDETHPPTGLRIRLLEERPRREPTVEIDDERGAAIERELGRFRRSCAEALVEARRARLYARYR